MKKIFSLSVYILFAALILSCSSKEKKEENTRESYQEWKQLDSFHMIMAEVFHPLKDSGNVEPARRLMTQLADEAEQLASSPLPEKVNNNEVKEKLQRLKEESRALANEIKEGTEDDVIGTRLYPIHDLFHEIQESWYKGGEEKESKEHEHH